MKKKTYKLHITSDENGYESMYYMNEGRSFTETVAGAEAIADYLIHTKYPGCKITYDDTGFAKVTFHIYEYVDGELKYRKDDSLLHIVDGEYGKYVAFVSDEDEVFADRILIKKGDKFLCVENRYEPKAAYRFDNLREAQKAAKEYNKEHKAKYKWSFEMALDFELVNESRRD